VQISASLGTHTGVCIGVLLHLVDTCVTYQHQQQLKGSGKRTPSIPVFKNA